MSYWIEDISDIISSNALDVTFANMYYISCLDSKRTSGPFNTRIEAEDELSDMIARGTLLG